VYQLYHSETLVCKVVRISFTCSQVITNFQSIP